MTNLLMKKLIPILALIASLMGFAKPVSAQDPFITTWQVAQAGDAISIPLNSNFTYDFHYEWTQGEVMLDSGRHSSDDGALTLTIANTDSVKLSITGDFPHFTGYTKTALRDVNQWGEIQWKSMEESFYKWPGESFSATDIPDLRQVESMSEMFYNAESFNGDISNWNVSNVTNMRYMFNSAVAFNQDLSNWDVSKVTDMSDMFALVLEEEEDERSMSFNGDISKWDVSNVIDMSSMFQKNDVFNGDLSNWNVSKVEDMSSMFAGSSFNGDISNWDVSNVKDMSHMFSYYDSFSGDISQWNVSKVEDMISMFAGSSFNGDISNWDVSNVKDMGYMFNDAVAFNQDLSSWDVGNVNTMYSMFASATSFNQNLSSWDVSNVTNMNSMFQNAVAFNQDLSSWDVSNAKNMSFMFYSAASFDQDLGNWNVKSLNSGAYNGAYRMFDNSGLSRRNYDQILMGWAANDSLKSNVRLGAQETTFCKGSAARDLLISQHGWIISDAGQVCSSANDILTFELAQLTGPATIDPTNHSVSAEVAFGTDMSALSPTLTLSEGASSNPANEDAIDFSSPVIYTVTAEDGTTSQDWTVTITVSPQDPFITTWQVAQAGDFISIPLNPNYTYDFHYEWTQGEVLLDSGTHRSGDGVLGLNMDNTDSVKLSITGDFPHFTGYTKTTLLDVNQWGEIQWKSMEESFYDWPGESFSATDIPDLRQVKSMFQMFYYAESFNGDIGTWNVSNVTDMSRMFANAAAFNQDLSSWDVSKVTAMSSMFANAAAFNQNLSSWDISNVTHIDYMFSRASAFNQNLSSWDISKVTTMTSIFAGAAAFNQDLSGWDISHLTELSSMFEDATSFDQDLSSWDVSNVTRMSNMFKGATSFNQDLSSWDVSNVTVMLHMFDSATSFNQDLSSWDVSKVTTMTSMFENATSFDQDLSSWDVSKVTDMDSMFKGATSFDQNLGNWNIKNLNSGFPSGAYEMFDNSGLSSRNYDQILMGWAANDSLKSDVHLGAQGIAFCQGSAARDSLISQYGWIISDAGLACSSANDILTFELTQLTGPAIIDPNNHTVSAEVAFGTNITALAPSITLSEEAISNPASGEVLDFTNPVIYQVIALDNSIQEWTVTVTAPRKETDILSFVLAEQTGAATINTTNHTVDIEVAFGTDLSALAPTLTLSEGASSNPASGETIDFSTDVVYTVTAEDGTTSQEWTVTVTEAPSEETDILSFVLVEQTGAATINTINHTVDIEVAFGTNLSALAPTLTLSEGATSDPASGETLDFSAAVIYTVTAEDGTTSQDWTVTVTEDEELPDTDTDILTFVLAEQTGAATINTTNHTVDIEVAFGTNLSALAPTLTLSEGAISDPASGETLDFSAAVIYTITAEDGTTSQEWIVTITEAPSEETDILSFVLDEQTGAATINTTNHTVDIEVAFGTDLSTLVPTLTLSEGATSDPASGETLDFSTEVIYTITAEDGTTSQEWTVKVSEASEPATILTAGEQLSLMVYPNPVQHTLHIQTDTPSHVKLIDFKGQVLLQADAIRTADLDLSGLQAGIYFLRVQEGNQITSRKIIKTN